MCDTSFFSSCNNVN